MNDVTFQQTIEKMKQLGELLYTEQEAIEHRLKELGSIDDNKHSEELNKFNDVLGDLDHELNQQGFRYKRFYDAVKLMEYVKEKHMEVKPDEAKPINP
jgi:hypothetical protein